VNDIYVSKHFKLKEFECRDNHTVKLYKELIDRLEIFRSLIGSRPIYINSGFRTPEYNKLIGGVKNSQHVKGRAVDIKKIDNMDIDVMSEYAKKAGFTGIGKYHWGIHVDIRPYQARWDNR